MRKLISALMVVMVVAMTIAMAVPAVAEEITPPPDPMEGKIYGYKWYDTNMDSYRDWDGTEGYVAGWPIELWKDGVLIASTTTDAGGQYQFVGLAQGVYQVKELMGPGWVQTYPASEGYQFYTFTITHESHIYSAPFKNYLTKRYAGFTPGYWGNKNGLAAMKGFVEGGGVLPSGMTAEQWKAYFRAGSTAVDMCNKLMWTYWAYWMNVNVKGLSYAGASVWIDGELVAYDDVIGDYAGCTGDRDVDEFYKDLFDGLNNINGYGFSVVPYAEL